MLGGGGQKPHNCPTQGQMLWQSGTREAGGGAGLPGAFGGQHASGEVEASHLIANYPRYSVSDTL